MPESAPSRIPARDFDYVEARLLAPTVPVSEALDRLFALDQGDLARDLAEAQAAFHDRCREIRRTLTDRYRGALS